MHVIIVACPHPMSCSICTASSPVLLYTYMLPSSPVLLHKGGEKEEMAFIYMEVLVYRSFTQSSKRVPTKIQLVKGTEHGIKKPFGIKIKEINICTDLVLDCLKN